MAKYLEYNQLQYLWGELKTKFAPISHNHLVSSITLTVPSGAGWAAPSPAYKDYPWCAVVNSASLKESSEPKMYQIITGNAKAEIENERDNFSCLCELVAADGYITLYAYDKPNTDITARLEV